MEPSHPFLACSKGNTPPSLNSPIQNLLSKTNQLTHYTIKQFYRRIHSVGVRHTTRR